MNNMNKINKMRLSSSFVILISCIVAFLIVLWVTNINIITGNKTNITNKEGFTSGIRQMFRPSIRNIRLFFENYYNLIKKNTSLFFRKIGVI
jgi:hypothetical protein